MEVWVADADGSNARQVSNLGQANWAPAYMPDGKRIIFASNHEYKRGFPFNLYTMDEDGSDLAKISRDKGFDAFPMFSLDGKKLFSVPIETMAEQEIQISLSLIGLIKLLRAFHAV
jgi:Tol biopolymer transport system component